MSSAEVSLSIRFFGNLEFGGECERKRERFGEDGDGGGDGDGDDERGRRSGEDGEEVKVSLVVQSFASRASRRRGIPVFSVVEGGEG